MELETLKDLYIHELKDLFSAEQQLVKALPKMAKAASNKELAAGFQEHLEQTTRAWQPGLRLIHRQATLHENYYGTFRDENDYPGQLFSKTETTDLDLAYTVWRDVTVAIGGKNITNEYPDKIKNSSSNTVYSTTGGLIDGEVYPRTGGPFGFNGAFYYVRLAAKF